jgi:hypothetical protein
MAPWKKMKEFSDEFGGFFQTEIMGDTHLWLGDHKISQELFGKRSDIYSSRPEVPAVPGSDTQGQYLPLMEYAGKSQAPFPVIHETHQLIVIQIPGDDSVNSRTWSLRSHTMLATTATPPTR